MSPTELVTNVRAVAHCRATCVNLLCLALSLLGSLSLDAQLGFGLLGALATLGSSTLGSETGEGFLGVDVLHNAIDWL